MMLRLARSRLGSYLVGWIFAQLSFILPVKRLRDTRTLLAFYHPRPAYLIHILIVPKKAIAGISDLTAEENGLMVEILQCAQSLVEEFGLEQVGCQLVLNGGAFQDVPQLHFHLVSDQHAVIEQPDRIADRD
ncbi:MAG: HIT domain-containing protein [Anaerolineales bacterium]|nr:HIT domain-containing protein [Anaerolineales bacterium]